MQPVKINCPHCNHLLEYWTRGNTIFCILCKDKIIVEPCDENLDHEITDVKGGVIEGEVDNVK